MCSQRQPATPSTSHFLTGTIAFAVILGLLAMLLSAELAHAAPAPRLDDAVLPAAGTQRTLLHTERFGRYAVLVRSLQGTALQPVDKMAGPGDVAGVPGERDGRLDLFLDRGTTKLLVHGHEAASGEVQLEAHAFEELNAGLAPILEGLALVETELGDFQQRSWWIDLDSRERVVLEAAGRHLADLRLWRDGSWLVGVEPSCDTVDPVEGRPLTRCQLTTELEPGLYLLSAYGGPSQPWSEDGPERPLWLRSGTPELGDAGRQRGEVSPFGEDRFLVPGSADLVRLELPEARPASVRVQGYQSASPFGAGGRSATIVEESVPPVAELRGSRHDGWNLVSVRGAAGQPYVLQHFEVARPVHAIDAHQPIWLSTLHAGSPLDSLEPTALLVRTHRHDDRIEIVASEVIELREDQAWSRRFDLLETATLFVKIEEPGTWAVSVDDPRADITVEPFMVRYPRHYERPDAQRGDSRWELDAGYHIVTIEPHRIGVAELRIRPHGLLDSVLGVVGMEREHKLQASRAGARFPSLELEPGWDYHLYTNRVPGVAMGLLQRELPLDLAQPLPVALGPGEQLELQVTVPSRGSLRLVTDGGELLEISANGKAWMSQPELRAGTHLLRLRNPGNAATVATLRHEDGARRPGAPQPTITMDALALLPEFPRITEGEPAFFDLVRGGRATFLLQVDEPALYVLESTGLLATEGTVRTRTVLSLASAAENGPGRNFMVQAYLGSGEYQVTVQARGRSTGHAGLRLRRTTMADGGELTHGIPARSAVPAGDGLVYRFSVAEAGRYDLSAIGEQRGFRCRLEDAEGWPVERPGGSLPSTRELEPGDYRIVLLPEQVATRRVTSVAPVAKELRFEGHGPHPLPLGRSVEHTWLEPQDGGERVPDRWAFELPAAARVSVSLGDELAGTLLAQDTAGAEEQAARIVPGQPWQGELAAGRYVLQARAARRDHGLPYRVLVQPEPLVVGTRRQISAPSTLGVAVGADGLVELASVGERDVRARLYATDGSLVASSDDRPEDWNFQLVERLEQGHYTLRVDPVGDDWARTTVVMSAPREREVDALKLGREISLEPGAEVLLVPLSGLGEDGVVAARATSAEAVGLVVEAQVEGRWNPVAEDAGRAALAVGRAGPAEGWRLRLWSLDRRGSPVKLAVSQPSPARIGEARMVRGTELSTSRAPVPTAAPLRVSLDRPGLLAVDGDPTLWCPHPLHACVPVENGRVAPLEETLWLVAILREADQRAVVSTERVALTSGAVPGAPVQLGPGDRVLADLDSALAGPVLVQASAVLGQPGVQVHDWHASPAVSYPAEGMDVGERAAVAVSLDARDPALMAWDAGAQPGDGIELRLEAHRFPAPLPEAVPPGSLDLPVPAGAARAWTLPAQPLRLRVTISAGLVAALEGAQGLERVAWAQRAPREIELHGEARRLVVLNPGSDPGRVALDLIPATCDHQRLLFGQPLERALPRSGSFRLDLPAATEAGTLHLRGAARQGVLIDAQGQVRRGLDLPLPSAGGSLEIQHEAGLVLAWIDRPGQEGEGLWGAVESPWAVDPTTPSVHPLEGAATQLGFAPERPLALHLRAEQALVLGLRHGEGPLEVAVHTGGDADLLLPGGHSTVLLRPLGEAELRGEIELSSTPIARLGEGLGPELLLAPGDTRFFDFALEHGATVGLGVRADADTVTLRLLDEQGRCVGRGLAQMPTLEPGRWTVAIGLSPDASPVSLQPVLVGLELPDTGPPEDVVQRYQRLASGAAPLPWDELPFPGEPDHEDYDEHDETYDEYDETYDEYDASSEEW